MRLAARDANALVCVQIGARNGPLLIVSSCVTPVTRHGSRRPHNKPVKPLDRRDGDSRAREAYISSSGARHTIQTGQTRQKTRPPRALTVIMMTGRHEKLLSAISPGSLTAELTETR